MRTAAWFFPSILLVATVAHADAPPKRGVRAVDVASLPSESLPPMLVAADRPASLPTTEGPKLGKRDELDAWRKKGRDVRSFAFETGGSAPSVVLVGGQGPSLASSAWVTCTPAGRTPATPVRWETFTVDANGASWTIHDGWADAQACRVVEQRKTVLHPKPVVDQNGTTLAFAIHDDDSLTLVVPGAASLAADAVAGVAKIQQGTIPRVVLPLRRGGSATAAWVVDPRGAAAWLANAQGTTPQAGGVGERVVVRIDVSQAVDEPAPTILATVARAG